MAAIDCYEAVACDTAGQTYKVSKIDADTIPVGNIGIVIISTNPLVRDVVTIDRTQVYNAHDWHIVRDSGTDNCAKAREKIS